MQENTYVSSTAILELTILNNNGGYLTASELDEKAQGYILGPTIYMSMHRLMLQKLVRVKMVKSPYIDKYVHAYKITKKGRDALDLWDEAYYNAQGIA